MLKKLTPAQQAWVDALRSGDYKQTTGVLQNKNGYCCLGVACVVAGQHGVALTRVPAMLRGITLNAQPGVAQWLQLKESSGRMSLPGFEGEPVHLTKLNDNAGLTFAEIADVIEYNAQYLFD